MQNIAYFLMAALVISHTTAIMFLKKKRDALDTASTDGQAKAKQFGLIIAILYIEIPVITAIIWFIVQPMLLASAH